jgi:phage gp36-like protein
MTYKLVDGVPRIVFSDGSVSPLEAVYKLGSRVIPAFRIDSNDEADSLASFLIGQDMQDAYADFDSYLLDRFTDAAENL